MWIGCIHPIHRRPKPTVTERLSKKCEIARRFEFGGAAFCRPRRLEAAPPKNSERVTRVMLQMKKIDPAALKRACDDA